MRLIWVGCIVFAMGFGLGCPDVPPPPGESRLLNQGMVRCGQDEMGETVRCDIGGDLVCCVDGDDRRCVEPGACGDTPLHCDDPSDCSDGQVCCGGPDWSRCMAPGDCDWAESCVTDWNCERGQICRENYFVSDIYLCD